jgi:hypothetical protein
MTSAARRAANTSHSWLNSRASSVSGIINPKIRSAFSHAAALGLPHPV